MSRQRDYKIYAVDFDGTLCEDKFPGIGFPKQNIIDFCKQKQRDGHKLILWTCREHDKLKKAVQWCAEHGLVFDAVNTNIPEEIDYYGNDCRKIGADFFIDDRNLLVEELNNV